MVSFLNEKDLARHLLKLRDQLKFEFYLPTTAKTLVRAFRVISFSTGKQVYNLKDCLTLTPEELMKIGREVEYSLEVISIFLRELFCCCPGH